MSLKEVVADIMEELQIALRESLVKQGHKLTGRLYDSIDFEVSGDERTIIGRMFFEDYGVYVETGVTSDRIPFSGRSGKLKGGTSKYIQGLVTFWEGRGLSGREAVGAAFATAYVHKRDGMPTRASSAFSQTGKRTGFVRSVIEEKGEGIENKLTEKYGQFIRVQILQAIEDFPNIKVKE